jgi:hypothetical protein
MINQLLRDPDAASGHPILPPSSKHLHPRKKFRNQIQKRNTNRHTAKRRDRTLHRAEAMAEAAGVETLEAIHETEGDLGLITMRALID